jgi:NADP-dependent 3-hydroxy acid dehydrogenase YdfG
MTQDFLKLLGTTRPGTIINISSIAATSVFPSAGGYPLSKLVEIKMQGYIIAENEILLQSACTLVWYQ